MTLPVNPVLFRLLRLGKLARAIRMVQMTSMLLEETSVRFSPKASRRVRPKKTARHLARAHSQQNTCTSKLARANFRVCSARASLYKRIGTTASSHEHENKLARAHPQEHTCKSALARANSHERTCATKLGLANLHEQTCRSKIARVHLREQTCTSALVPQRARTSTRTSYLVICARDSLRGLAPTLCGDGVADVKNWSDAWWNLLGLHCEQRAQEACAEQLAQ